MASSTGSDYSQRHHHRLVIFPSSCHRSATFNLPPCHVKSSTASTMRQDVSSFSVARYCSSFTTLVSNRIRMNDDQVASASFIYLKIKGHAKAYPVCIGFLCCCIW
ncbi:hypothetical protein AHAS_Ahas02G0129800 [Arachis hypogaea]